MKNLIQDGTVLDHTVLVGETPIASGDVVVEGTMIGVAVTSGVTDDVIAVNLVGVYLLAKTTSLVITKGDRVFWNTTTKKVTKTVTDKPLGFAWTSELTNATTVQVKLDAEQNGSLTQATVVAAVVDNGGGATANGTIGAITLTEPANLAAQTVINQQIADAIKELSTKQNEVLTVLKAAGLMASA